VSKTSYALSLLVAKRKKSLNIAEELIIPCAVEIASIMFDEKTASVIKAIPSSDNTVQRRIRDMASDTVDQVVEKISKCKQFSIQLDESTDTAGEAKLLAFVRVPDSDDIMEHILFCRSLREKMTRNF
jgi:DNA-binding Lrp family transcriptional regulator